MCVFWIKKRNKTAIPANHATASHGTQSVRAAASPLTHARAGIRSGKRRKFNPCSELF